MHSYGYQTYKQKILEEVSRTDELKAQKLKNEELIEAMKAEQARHSERNKELQEEIVRLSVINNRIKKLICT